MAPATSGHSNASPAGMLPLEAARIFRLLTSSSLIVVPLPFRPSLWNRTRTSRSSAERADQLRERGMFALRVRPSSWESPIDRAARFHRHQLFSCQRTPACVGRTSGVDAAARAGACAGAPISIRYLDWESRYRVAESDCVSGIAARDVGWMDPKTSKGRWGGLPWAALQLATCGHVVSGGDPRGYRWPDRAFRSHSTQTAE
jgi:hypothetical protein